MTTTPNLGLTVPLVGGDADIWGGELNTDLGLIDAIFSKTGTQVGLNSPLIAYTETSIASATTTDLSTVASDRISISGTTTITSLGTASINRIVRVRFTGASLILTYNATTLITPTGANIQTAAGDNCIVAFDASGNATIISYAPVGGVLTSSFSNQNLSGSPTHLATVVITPGKWRFSFTIVFNGTTSATYVFGVLSTTIDSSTSTWPTVPRVDGAIGSGGAGSLSHTTDITVSSSTTYYLNVAAPGTSTGGLNGILRAERIY